MRSKYTGSGIHRRMLAFAIVAVVALAGAACGGGDEGTGQQTSPSSNQDTTSTSQSSGTSVAAPLSEGSGSGDTLVIGADFPLTGALSFLGESYERGAELRVDQLNEAGEGPSVKLVVYDDESSPESSARVAQRLLTRDNVNAIIGTASVPNTAAVAAAANAAGVPFIAISGYAVDPAKDPMVFNMAHRSEDAAAPAFEYFAKQGWTHMALLMATGPLGEEGNRVAELLAKEYGLQIVARESFDTTTADVTSQLASLRSADPDVVYSFTTGKPAALIARNMANLGMDVPLLVSHGNGTLGFLEMMSGLSTQVFIPSGRVMVPQSLEPDDVAAKFVAAYRNRYGEDPDYFAGMGYDVVSLLHAAAKAVGSVVPESLIKGLEGVSGLEGVTAVYSMSPEDHHGTDPEQVVLLTVKDGKFVLVARR